MLNCQLYFRFQRRGRHAEKGPKRGGAAPWGLGFCTVQCYNEKKHCGTRAFPPGARNKIQRRRNYSMGLKEQIEKLNPYLRDSSYIKQNA